jgi:hypothetical protein
MREGYQCGNGYCAPAPADGGAADLRTTPADGASHDLATIDLALPDLAMPDLAMPDLATPDLAMPDLAMPDLAAPDLVTLPDLVATPDLASKGPVVFGNGVAFADGTPNNVGDFDSDGKLDLLAGFFWHGNGDGTFTKGPAQTVTGQFQIDLDSDGGLDLVSGTNTNASVLPYLGKKDGTFTAKPAVTWPNGTIAGRLCGVGDVDGDAKPDLVAQIEPILMFSYTYVAPGNGDGTFGAWQNRGGDGGTSYQTQGACALADLDGNGTLDVFFFESPVSEGAAYGDGKGNFAAAGIAFQATGQVIGAGKFDGSGRTNVLSYGYDKNLDMQQKYIEIFLDPKTPKSIYANPVTTPTAIVGDFTGDGKLDLFATTTTLSLFVGNGDGTFQAPVAYPAAGADGCVLAGDFNRDGKLDLACSGLVLLQQ